MPLQPSCIEVALLEEPVHVLDFRQSFLRIYIITTEKSSCGGDRTPVPSDGILWSERSTTELAGPGPSLCLIDANNSITHPWYELLETSKIGTFQCLYSSSQCLFCLIKYLPIEICGGATQFCNLEYRLTNIKHQIGIRLGIKLFYKAWASYSIE